MPSLSCSRADAVSLKASTLTKTNIRQKNTAFLFPSNHVQLLKLRHSVKRTRAAPKKTRMARPVIVPDFQLIQSFQQSSGAISHGQCPAELAADRFVHLRLDFRLSHNN